MLYPLSYEGWDREDSIGQGHRALWRGLRMPAMPDATVLVVDDDPVIQKLLQVNFEMEGYSVITAGDGEEGLRRAQAERPDIVLLDIMMPKMNGLEVAAALKADDETAGIPVILLSAKAQSSDVQAGMEAGADDYITKPFDPLELLDRVRELLTR